MVVWSKEKGTDCREHEEVLQGDEKFLYTVLNIKDNYPSVYICQSPSNYTLKIYT